MGRFALLLVATEWGTSTGLCENGDPKLKQTEALEFMDCLARANGERTRMYSAEWKARSSSLPTCKVPEAKLKLAEKLKLDKELCNLQG